MLTLFVRRSDLVIWIDSPIVCWLAAPFKKLPCIIAELFYCHCLVDRFHLISMGVVRPDIFIFIIRSLRGATGKWEYCMLIERSTPINLKMSASTTSGLLTYSSNHKILIRWSGKCFRYALIFFPYLLESIMFGFFRTISFMEVFKNKKPGVDIHST